MSSELRPFHIALPTNGSPEDVSGPLVADSGCKMGRVDPGIWNDVDMFGLGHQVVYHNAGFALVPIRSDRAGSDAPVPRFSIELGQDQLAGLKANSGVASGFPYLDSCSGQIIDPLGYVWELNSGKTSVPGRVSLHLPTKSVEKTGGFFAKIPRCKIASFNAGVLEIDFFGHRIFLHRAQSDFVPTAGTGNDVDGKKVQVPHFGPVLTMDDWHAFVAELDPDNSDLDIVLGPYTRFEGEAGEQGTVFIRSAEGLQVEVKGFVNDSAIFAA